MPLKRKVGRLERFSLDKGVAHAYVRLDSELLHLPMANRGVLQTNNKIEQCINGDRYLPLQRGSSIAIDVHLDREGKKPYAVAWAPVVRNGGPQK